MNEQSLLKYACRGNGMFSGLSGLLMMVLPGVIGNLLGYPFPLLYIGIGGGLLAYAVLLFYSTGRDRVHPAWVWCFIAGDLAWVIGTAIVLIAGSELFSKTGTLILIGVALVVLAFAVLQLIGYMRAREKT